MFWVFWVASPSCYIVLGRGLGLLAKDARQNTVECAAAALKGQRYPVTRSFIDVETVTCQTLSKQPHA